MWARYVILLVITFNNISLSLLIAFIYHIFLPDYIPNMLNLTHQLFGIGFFLLHYWNARACHLIIEKCTNLSSYSPTSRLLGCKLFWSNSIEIWITSDSFINYKLMMQSLNYFPTILVACNVEEKCLQSTQSSKLMKSLYGWWNAQLIECNEYYFLVDGWSQLL